MISTQAQGAFPQAVLPQLASRIPLTCWSGKVSGTRALLEALALLRLAGATLPFGVGLGG